MQLVRIIIPLYKELNAVELVSIKQCFSIMGRYPVTVVCPPQLDLRQIRDLAKLCRKEISVELFEAKYFLDVNGYNKLMLSASFYERFEDSKYLLIYQTDSFVFKDDLKHWCSLKYDYIAAPWPFDVTSWIDVYPKEIKRYYKIFGRKGISRIGNGGLSLRNTRSFIRNLRFFKRAVEEWNLNEDMFYSHYVNTLNPFFRIPKVEVAARFAFDVDPEGFFRMNNQELPFGCHGWHRDDEDYKGNLSFYKQFVEGYGYCID
ncbi:DUF5672 family protein [Arcticibacter sp.]